MVSLEEKKRLYAAAPPSWGCYKLHRAFDVSSSPVSAYKSNTMADVDGAGTVGSKRDVYMQIAIADHVAIVIIQFLDRALHWSKQRLEDMPEHDPRMVESGRSVMFALPTDVLGRVRRVGISRVVL